MIIVDTREPKKYYTLGHVVDSIWVDFIVEGEHGKYSIERKSINDFASSLSSGRIWEQLKRLKQLHDDEGYIPILAIHGNIYRVLKSKRLNEAQLSGFIAYCVEQDIQTIMFPNEAGFIMFLYRLNDRVEGKHKTKYKRPSKIKKTGRDIRNEVKDILMAFQGIGNTTATKLLEHYGTLHNIFNADDLSSVVNKRIAGHIKKALSYKWGENND